MRSLWAASCSLALASELTLPDDGVGYRHSLAWGELTFSDCGKMTASNRR